MTVVQKLAKNSQHDSPCSLALFMSFYICMTHNPWLNKWILEWRFVQNNALNLEKLEISVGIIY